MTKNWICDCPEGFIIPIDFSQCTRCKAIQRVQIREPNERFVTFYKPYTPEMSKVWDREELMYCGMCDQHHKKLYEKL